MRVGVVGDLSCAPDWGTLIFRATMKYKPKISAPPGLSLYQNALDISRRETLETLARKTGLPFSWLRKFRAGQIKSPGVQRVEKILTAFEA